jgi:aryl-alcohol dehydrogenase-like predicted oxidoreductase
VPEARRQEVFADKNFDRVEALERWAREHGHSLLELSFAWLLARPMVASVIAGATKPEQVRANAAAASWQLTPRDCEEIDALIERVKTGAAR